MSASDTGTPAASSARELASRALALLLGLAVPTGFFSWLLGFDAIKKRINGRLWCSDHGIRAAGLGEFGHGEREHAMGMYARV